MTKPSTLAPFPRIAPRRRGALVVAGSMILASFLSSAASAQTTAPANLEVLVADFNHDGIPDVLIPSQTGPNVTIAFGTVPYGTFSPATRAVTSPSACVTSGVGGVQFGLVVAADFNGDGSPDIFFTCGTSTNTEANLSGVILGHGDGTFGPPVLLTAPFALGAVAGDFNKDGKMDLVVLAYPSGRTNTSYQSPSLLFFAGNGDGTFAQPIASPLGSSATFQPTSYALRAPVSADIDGDGYPDIVLNAAFGGSGNPGNGQLDGATITVSVFGNKKDGTFGIVSQATRLPDVTATLGASPDVSPAKVLLGNFFAPASADLAVPDTGTNAGIFLLRNTSTPNNFSFAAPAKTAYANLQSAATATFTGSGFSDLAVSNGTTIAALTNDGTGNFTANYASLSVATAYPFFAIADANGDGHSDIYTANLLNGALSLAVNLVSGSATATTAPLTLPVGTTQLSATWPGNINYSSSSVSGTQTVTLAPTTVTLTATPNPSTAGAPVTFNAAVAPASATGVIPTGTVILRDGYTTIGTATLDSTGAATLTISSLSVGTHAIQAQYSGDSFFSLNYSSTLNQVVTQPPAITPTLTWAPAPVTVGTALGATQLNAVATDATGAIVSGAYIYTPPAGTILTTPGSQILSVTFTPTDQTAYNAASLSAPISVLPANQAPLTTNLLLNPGAELGLADGAIPNWTPAGEGSPTVDSGTFDNGINPHTGTYDFLGNNGPADSLSQTVSLLTQGITATLLDSGTVSASLSFWEQGLSQGTPSDDASVTLTFLDTENNTLSSINSGEIDSHNGTWQNLTASYPIPVGTRSITYTMNFIRHSGSDLDAFVDDNSLILTTAPTAVSTTTTLAVTSGTTAVTTVASGTPITLTATVLAGTTPVTPGQVNFCDAGATYCTDMYLLGTAQLTSAGTAALKFIPGIGIHSYKAVFIGTKTNAASTSSAQALTVTGSYPTQTTIASSGTAAAYTLTSTVVGTGSPSTSTTGTVSFLNTTKSNAPLGTAALGASVATLSFNGITNTTTGEYPQSRSAIGDFNGDGISDIAIANTAPYPNPTIYANTVTIAIGNGDGTFTSLAGHPATGTNPVGIVAADFNADGKLDLATANGTSGSFSVLLGNGDGTFAAAITAPAGTNAYGIVAADFNADGIVDLAVSQANGVSIFLGKGDGTFTQSVISITGSQSAIVTADFNGDGKADLAIQSSYPQEVVVLLGNGDGTFTTSATIVSGSTGSNLNAIAVGDFNGDGKPDMAVTNSIANVVNILTGNGDGTFTSSVVVPATFQNPIDIRTADFNGDGKLDLVTVNANEDSARETVFLGSGDGTFTSAAIPTGVYAFAGAAVGDFNGDGVPDLVSSIGTSTYVALTQRSQTATATLSNITIPGTGTNQIIASYPGDTNYAPSTSNPIPLTAQLVPTTTTLASSLNPSTAGTSVTFSATITPAIFNGLTATGSVTFTDGTSPLATVLLSSTGTATFTISTLTATTHTILAVYSGDTNFAPSNTSLSQVVQPALGLTFSSRNLSFGNQTVGTQSAPQAVLVSNLTGVTVNIYDILLILGAAPSDFVQTNNCPAAFLPGTTCTVNVSFTPHGVGIKTAGIEIDTDSNPSFQSINFAGTGTGGILQVNPGNLKTIAGTGVAGFTGDNGPATAATLNLPAGVVVDPTGIVYIADELNSVVRKVDLTGKITTIAGTGVPAYTGDGGLATAATLKYPATLTLDTAGNLYIFDDGNNVVRKITASTGIITTVAGTGTAGHSGDGGPATSARLNQPQGGKFDRAGNLYIPDCVGSNLRKVDTNGIITTVAGNFTAGFSGDGGPATSAQLYCPSGVDIDAAGNLYIADDLNHRIRKVDTSGIITTIAGDGAAAYNGDNIPAATAELNLPNDVALDAAGNLYIADSGNNRIRRIDTTGTITTVAGGLQNAGSAGVNTPLSLTIAPSGNLYFVDSGNNAVRQLFPAGATPFPPTVIGTPATPQSLTLSNIGNVAVSIASAQSFTLTGNATDFALTGGTCLTGATLAANGGSCTLQVVFTPTATGLRMLTVSVVDSALNSPQSFTTSGTGIAATTPILTWTPAVSSIPYGAALGPQQLNAVATTPTGAPLTGTFVYTPAAGTVLSAGTQTLSVTFTPTGTLYTAVTATRTITVAQATPSLTWATPAAIVQGTALSATQLNATASGVTGTALPGVLTYTPAAGTVPAAGTQTLSVLFTPTDALDYTTATATVRLTVTGLSLTAITPGTAKVGDPATTLTLTGAGFTTGSVAQVNGARVSTTYVNPTTLTAIVPATNFAAVGTLAITVANPATSTVTSALPLIVTTPTPSITLTGPTVTQPGTQPSLALTITNPYPIPLTATFTLSFTSTVTPTVDDPAIQFAGGGRTFTFTVPANSTTVPAIQLQAGTVAGTITIPLTLTAAGVNVTPTTVQPITIVVPGAVPAVTTATITRAATTFTVTIHGFSNTREVTTATFHFTPTTGAQIDTPDVTIPVSTIFSAWFTSAPSVPYGSTFTYTQVFNVSDTAANIGSVQVTLTNAVGVSTTYTAQ